ncbi:MAG: hypothetical protein K0U38_08520 [Epsilonproteobacteria bacterium]|nr:hypothetical protein [Campylobacterota bacterium]
MKKLDKQLRSNKFDYILDEYLSAVEVQNIFGYDSPNMMYKLRHGESPLTEPHIKHLEYNCNIPSEVFEKRIPFNREDTSNIDSIIKEHYKKLGGQEFIAKNNNHLFYENPKLLQKLTGEWYAHFYASAESRGVYAIKTTIQSDGVIVDENNNRGRLFLGKKQSMIIKESHNSENLVSITFENTQVAFNLFYFSMLSKQNLTNQEMLSFGFLSKKMFTQEETEKILGRKERQQLKIDFEFTQRISEAVQVLRE